MKKVNYFDLGLYKGEEIDMFKNELKNNVNYEIYGFEAHPNYCKTLSLKYKDDKNIHIINRAITSFEMHEKDLELYINDNHYDGQGNSLYKSKNNVNVDKTIKTQGISFVKWLYENNIDLDNNYNILRFNIEGSEYVLIKELVKFGLINKFNLFLGSKPGMDIEKVSELKDKYSEYINMLNDNSVRILPYCGELDNNVNLKHMLVKDGVLNHFILYDM